ncbi:hypothetical protein GGTG_09502 [Gaeumannomyces tritici R3-111a-1]|uniref:Alpha/beta hydrolase fold-3 domain-containing protein n=1 Tax=Gaeumannomyces tritici (strain R3-111a-1) TaxID=644352 RepID=J3P7L0_GAET3|nr:hypothetical protein GGTG_09502 [Gaeumannomyces tritici R3-111a-1]EJT72642.1 hypothetical protein GGTG_09502 [Gaeumannomyces tritici R3-111a-1]
MLLGPVSYLDCLVFCVFLAPQLIYQAGLADTVACALRCLPFILYRLPRDFLRDRFASSGRLTPFAQRADGFEDFVIRCVRYAFANVPPRIARIFFDRNVALPFLRWRMLRHGYVRSPVHWREYEEKHFKGVWIVSDPSRRPDVVLYYLHGGGFSMGSAYFYLDFLLAWHHILVESGYSNPAIFGLEYTLVPDACFPTQLDEAIRGYNHVLSMAEDPSIVVLGGDSAGAALALSLLLHLGRDKSYTPGKGGTPSGAAEVWTELPAMAVLISPWTTLVSQSQHNTESDYLDVDTLHRFGTNYCGPNHSVDEPLVSPGRCEDRQWLQRAGPAKGVFVTYGEDEVFAPETKRLVKTWQDAGVKVSSLGEEAGVHAWPVASIFISTQKERRLKSLRSIVAMMREQIS